MHIVIRIPNSVMLLVPVLLFLVPAVAHMVKPLLAAPSLPSSVGAEERLDALWREIEEYDRAVAAADREEAG